MVRVLGEGSRGVSYMVATPDDVSSSAPTVVATVSRSSTNAPNFRNDDRAASVKHRLLRTVYEMRRVDGTDVVLSEYLDGGSLAQPVKPTSELDAVRALVDAGRALHVWHAAGLTHGAVHANNVLLTASGAVLADRKSFPSTDVLPVGPLPTTLYCRAPEVIRGDAVTVAADVWSYGAMVHRVLTGRHVYAEVFSDDRLDAINAALGEPLTMHGPLSPARAGLISRCLDLDPDRRPSSIVDVIESLAATIQSSGS